MSKKQLSFILLLCSVLFCNAQDTIVLKTEEHLLVRVLEVSVNEVRYKHFYNPDGVIRVLNYNEIKSVTYENGKKETRFLNLDKSQSSNEPYFIIENNHISLRNKDLTHKEAFNIMLKKDPLTNSDDLNTLLLNAESKKNGQIGFMVVAPVCLIGGFYFAKRNYYGPNDVLRFKTILLSGVGLAACSFITAQVYKTFKNKNIRKAANLYNQELLSD